MSSQGQVQPSNIDQTSPSAPIEKSSTPASLQQGEDSQEPAISKPPAQKAVQGRSAVPEQGQGQGIHGDVSPTEVIGAWKTPLPTSTPTSAVSSPAGTPSQTHNKRTISASNGPSSSSPQQQQQSISSAQDKENDENWVTVSAPSSYRRLSLGPKGFHRLQARRDSLAESNSRPGSNRSTPTNSPGTTPNARTRKLSSRAAGEWDRGDSSPGKGRKLRNRSSISRPAPEDNKQQEIKVEKMLRPEPRDPSLPVLTFSREELFKYAPTSTYMSNKLNRKLTKLNVKRLKRRFSMVSDVDGMAIMQFQAEILARDPGTSEAKEQKENAPSTPIAPTKKLDAAKVARSMDRRMSSPACLVNPATDAVDSSDVSTVHVMSEETVPYYRCWRCLKAVTTAEQIHWRTSVGVKKICVDCEKVINENALVPRQALPAEEAGGEKKPAMTDEERALQIDIAEEKEAAARLSLGVPAASPPAPRPQVQVRADAPVFHPSSKSKLSADSPVFDPSHHLGEETADLSLGPGFKNPPRALSRRHFSANTPREYRVAAVTGQTPEASPASSPVNYTVPQKSRLVKLESEPAKLPGRAGSFSMPHEAKPELILAPTIDDLVNRFSNDFNVEVVKELVPSLDALLRTEGCGLCLRRSRLGPWQTGAKDYDSDAKRTAEQDTGEKIKQEEAPSAPKDQEKFLLLTCPLLSCQHLVHLSCAEYSVSHNNPTFPASPRTPTDGGVEVLDAPSLLRPPHVRQHITTSYFRTVPLPETPDLTSHQDLANVTTDPSSTLFCSLELSFTHAVSTAQMMQVYWNDLATGTDLKKKSQVLFTVMDKTRAPQGSSDFLMNACVTPSSKSISSRLMQRGTVSITVMDHTTTDQPRSWHHACNYDLSTLGSSNSSHIKLVYIDPSSGHTLVLGLDRKARAAKNEQEEQEQEQGLGGEKDVQYSLYRLSYVKYEFFPAPLPQPVFDHPTGTGFATLCGIQPPSANPASWVPTYDVVFDPLTGQRHRKLNKPVTSPALPLPLRVPTESPDFSRFKLGNMPSFPNTSSSFGHDLHDSLPLYAPHQTFMRPPSPSPSLTVPLSAFSSPLASPTTADALPLMHSLPQSAALPHFAPAPAASGQSVLQTGAVPFLPAALTQALESGVDSLTLSKLIQGHVAAILKTHKGSLLIQKYLENMAGGQPPILPRRDSLGGRKSGEGKGTEVKVVKVSQDSLSDGDRALFEVLWSEVSDDVAVLMMNRFAQYAIERIVGLSTDSQRQHLLSKLAPDIITVSCNMDGSFAVQALIDSLSTPQHIATLFAALSNGVDRLITSRSGYFVVLRSLERFPYQFTRIFDQAVIANGMMVFNNRYGLQVFRQLMKVRQPSQLTTLFDSVEKVTVDLARTESGNFVVQAVLDSAPDSIRMRIFNKLCGNFQSLACHKFGSCVVERCLKLCASGNSAVPATIANQVLPTNVTTTSLPVTMWRTRIIQEICAQPDVAKLLKDRYGNYVLQTALSVAGPASSGPASAESIASVREMCNNIIPHLRILSSKVRSKWIQLITSAAANVGLDANTLAGGALLTLSADDSGSNTPSSGSPNQMPRDGPDAAPEFPARQRRGSFDVSFERRMSENGRNRERRASYDSRDPSRRASIDSRRNSLSGDFSARRSMDFSSFNGNGDQAYSRRASGEFNNLKSHSRRNSQSS